MIHYDKINLFSLPFRRLLKTGLKNYQCENIHSTSDKNVHENECFCG